MTDHIIRSGIGDLRGTFRGDLLSPGDEGYEVHRKVWNAMIDKRPALIARCTGVEDVIEAVNFARGLGLLVSVRGGAHNYAGHATCDGGLVIDLSPMKDIRIDPVRGTVRAQAGVKLGELDRETQAFGLATTMGVVTDTGIAGLTLGGGIGWLMSKYGLACDNLVSADVVTAAGRLLATSEAENGDLFWALRGGSGNFGVVTSFEYQLHQVGPTVFGGMTLYPLGQGKEVLRFYREYTATIPDELTLMAGFLTAPDGNVMAAVAGCYCGDLARAEEVLKPLRSFGSPVQDLFGPMPYLALQSMFDAAFPAGANNYVKSDYLNALQDEVIEVILDGASRITSPLSYVMLVHFHGAVTRVLPEATAFPHRRDQQYSIMIYGTSFEPSEEPRQIRWVRDLWQSIQPYASGGVYVNEMGFDEREDRFRIAYGPNYGRLRGLKTKYDPLNFFRLNANIQPIS